MEKNLLIKEQEIRNWENRFQQLNKYCKMFEERNVCTRIINIIGFVKVYILEKIYYYECYRLSVYNLYDLKNNNFLCSIF